MSLATVTDIFPNATVVAGELRIPSGDIISYTPSSVSSPTGAEMIYGLLQTISEAVAASGYTNVIVSTSGSLTNAGTTLRRLYNFTINLDFDGDAYAGLDVKSEPAWY